MKTRVLVVGLGQSGARFIRALLALGAQNPALSVVAGVDADPEKCRTFEALGIACFATLERAVAMLPIDIVIVTVPELNHFTVLEDVRRLFPNAQRILCEKPLAASLDEARALGRLYSGRELTLNFVERFSPTVEDLLAFIAGRRRRVARINCTWGKYRIKDPRPTPGVVSVELAHPIDLALLIGGVPSGAAFDIVSVASASSNFDIGEERPEPLDTVHVALRFATGLQMMASTSLVWAERRRQIEAILTDEAGFASELAVLRFDDPIWDIDSLAIYDIRAVGGRPVLLQRREVTAADWPADRITIGKVCRFVEANLAELQGRPSALLPGLEDGIYVQAIMESITEAANRSALNLRCFVPPADAGLSALAGKVDMLGRMARGGPVRDEEFVWDRLY